MISSTHILLACPIAFFAGLIDSIAGGGGLIQVPGLLLLFPNMPVVNLLGTNKFAMSAGTIMSSYHYARTLHIDYRTLIPGLIAAFIFSVIGAHVVSNIGSEILRPLILILLIVIGIFTLIKKDFGIVSKKKIQGTPLVILVMVIGAIFGFYDGFFGPGTGSFLMFSFVGLIGFSFLEGSAFAKLINLSANLAALLFFALTHRILYYVAVPMALFNIAGNLVGAKLAIKKGSGFVRVIFLFVILAIIIQMLYEMHLI